jgi:hypothetical protein
MEVAVSMRKPVAVIAASVPRIIPFGGSMAGVLLALSLLLTLAACLLLSL